VTSFIYSFRENLILTLIRELATYYAQSTQSPAPSATYLIIGSEHGHRHEESGMDVDINLDDDPEGGFEDGEDVPQTKFLLVTDEELEGMLSILLETIAIWLNRYFQEAKTKFQQINAVHICSLSPSIIRVRTTLRFLCPHTVYLR
jgi:hypothetical protein